MKIIVDNGISAKFSIEEYKDVPKEIICELIIPELYYLRNTYDRKITDSSCTIGYMLDVLRKDDAPIGIKQFTEANPESNKERKLVRLIYTFDFGLLKFLTNTFSISNFKETVNIEDLVEFETNIVIDRLKYTPSYFFLDERSLSEYFDILRREYCRINQCDNSFIDIILKMNPIDMSQTFMLTKGMPK